MPGSSRSSGRWRRSPRSAGSPSRRSRTSSRRPTSCWSSGYALGGGPGFAVGALAGLASNFFFGQGPWTPWQMAGWGAVGVIGAGLAVLTGRRIGRWPLAVVCAVVGFAFTALQDVGDWVTYSDHSLAQLGVYVGKGVGFDFVHAAGCFVFALAFGPALIRSLSRFTLRLNVTWRTATPLLALALTAWLATQPGVLGDGRAAAANTPAGYLIAAQNSDGGIGATPGSSSSQLYSGWAALGLAAAGENPLDVAHDGHSLIGYAETGAGSSDPGDVERNILVAGAAGLAGHELRRAQPPRRAPGRHPAERVGEQPDELDVVRRTRAAVGGRRAAGGQPRVARAPAGFGRRLQLRHPWRAERRRRHRSRRSRRSRAPAGPRPRGRGPWRSPTSAASRTATAASPACPARARTPSRQRSAVQGLLAAGADPSSLHRKGAPSPLDYLRSLIAGDGHIRYARGSDETPTWVTGEALMALEGKALPVAAPARRTAPAPARPRTHDDHSYDRHDGNVVHDGDEHREPEGQGAASGQGPPAARQAGRRGRRGRAGGGLRSARERRGSPDRGGAGVPEPKLNPSQDEFCTLGRSLC